MKDADYKSILNTAFSLLSVRSHSKYELEKKLAKRFYNNDLILKVLDECKRLGFIDDAQFTKLYVAELKYKGQGTYKLRLSLKKKGLSNELINKEIDDYSEEEQLNDAILVYERKQKSFLREEDAYKRKQKVYRFMYGRGFSSEIINKLMNVKQI